MGVGVMRFPLIHWLLFAALLANAILSTRVVEVFAVGYVFGLAVASTVDWGTRR